MMKVVLLLGGVFALLCTFLCVACILVGARSEDANPGSGENHQGE